MEQSIRIATGKAEFKKLQKDWSELLNKISNKRFYHYYEWYKSYFNALEPNLESIFFVVLSSRSVAQAIIPLKKIRGAIFEFLELPLLELAAANERGSLLGLLSQEENLPSHFLHCLFHPRRDLFGEGLPEALNPGLEE